MKNRYKDLVNYLNCINYEISDYQLEQFDNYYNLLIDWNKKINLTAIIDFNDVIWKHFIDSIALLKYYKFNNTSSIIDLGTGAGFPGIPLKILLPDVNFTLVDSLNKRLKFLQIVIDELCLKNINLVHGRAEDVSRETLFREKFDLCVSRAVANLSTLTEYCSPFIKIGGYFIPYKSDKADEEINNAGICIKKLKCNIEKIERFKYNDNERCFIFIKKYNKTPDIYPRKAGTPAKEPL